MRTFKLITVIGLLLCSVNFYAQNEINREDFDSAPELTTITPELKEKIHKKIERRLDVFRELLDKIGSKTPGVEDRISYVVKTIFIYKEATTVGVTNAKNRKFTRPIEEYLWRLYKLPYKSVQFYFPRIYFTEIKYERGYYWGTVVVEQIFEGTMATVENKKYKYRDTTYKKIQFRVSFDSENPDDCIVLFGDLSVVEKEEGKQFQYDVIR